MAATEGRIWSRGSYNRLTDSSFGQWTILLLGESLFLLPFIAFVPALIAFHKKIENPSQMAFWMPSFRNPVRRYLRFGLLSAAYYFFPIIVAFSSALPLKNLVELPLYLTFGHFLGLTLTSRMSLVFPAIAINQRLGLIESWKVTGANSTKIFFVLFLAILPLLLITLTCIAALYVPAFSFWNADPQILGAAISSSMKSAVFVITPILFCIALVFTSCTSEIYKRLVKPADSDENTHIA